jgi:hypothetical protein
MADKEDGISKFVYILEIVYAILLSWGFARVAERFTVHHLLYWLCMLVSLLTLIRFFFAPSHNIGVVAKLVRSRKRSARVVVFFDISLLIAHSFIFFRMCYAVGDMRYDFFYRDFAILLLVNSFWLATITFRQRRAKISPHDKHAFWQMNNLVCGSLIMAMFLLKADLLLMFIVALTNCTLDLWTCAPYYLEPV